MSHCPSCGSVLPDPPGRFCPVCGTELASPGDVLAPPPPAEPPPFAAPPPAGAPGDSGPGPQGGSGTPWERRRHLGLVSALVDTTQQVLTAPAEFFRRMPVSGGIGAPLGYALIVGFVGIVVNAIYDSIFRSILGPSLAGLGGRGELDRILPYLQADVGFLWRVIAGPGFLLAGLFGIAAVTHLGLLLVGGGRGGFESTFRVVCYGEAAAIFNVIPICGGLVSLVYFLVVAIIGLSEAQGVSRGTAALAVLLPLVLLCCCCGGIVALVVGGAASALRHL